MSSQGQVTVPKVVRELLDLQPGDEVEFDTRGPQVVLRKATSGIDWDRAYGIVDFHGRSTDEIMAEIRPKDSEDR
jgi:AbrB family looped-hinge helix DNA binding protein